MEAVIKFADLTVRSLLILNGGAALAVLSFAANKAGSNSALAWSVWYFGVGAACSVATAALSYFGQSFFSHDRDSIGCWFQGSAIVFGFAGWLLFLFGMLDASSRM